MDAIVTYDLSKQYGERIALCGINLQIPQGSAFACVGEEKCGKTTIIRLLSGLCRPTMGECTVLGLSPSFEPEKLHSVTGTVLETARLYDNMTLSENLSFFAGMQNVDSNDAVERASFLLHKLDIWESRDEKVDNLPTGVIRRACLARALMHSPRVLLMDEPASGLDKETGESIKELISLLIQEEGLTLFLSTRNMDYAQQMCESYAILKAGSMLAKGSMESLRKGAGMGFHVGMKIKEGDNPLPGFHMENDLWVKEVASPEDVPRLISQAVNQSITLYEARLIEPTLEEIYKAYRDGRTRKVGEADEQGNQNHRAETGSPDPEGQPDQRTADPGENSGYQEVQPSEAVFLSGDDTGEQGFEDYLGE